MLLASMFEVMGWPWLILISATAPVELTLALPGLACAAPLPITSSIDL